MSGKITRLSESIRTHDENEYKKGDLSYARNRTIGAGTESEDEYDAAEMARRMQMHGTGGSEEATREHYSGKTCYGETKYGKSDSGNTIVNKGRVASGSKYVPYAGKGNLKPPATEDNVPLNRSNDVNVGISEENKDNMAGITKHNVSSRNAPPSNRLRQAYRQISSKNKAYNRTSEALTNARRKITKASLNSVKKSGETAANVMTLGRYKAVKESRDAKKKRKAIYERSQNGNAKIKRKSGKRPLLRKRTAVGKLGNAMTRTIAMSNVQAAQKEVQAGMMESAGVATALAIKMVAVVMMVANIVAKLALLVVTVIVGIIVVAVTSLAGVVAAIVAVVVLVAGIIGIVVSVNDEEDDGSTRIGMHSFVSVYEDLEEQYENKITSLVEIGRNAGCESYQIEGEKADAEDVLAVYLAADTTNGYGTFDADTVWFVIDANGINLLTEIYWDMNETEYFIEADENGPKKMLITAKAKDKETVAGEYNAESQLDVVSAHYFHLFNMIRNAGQDGRYVLPVGDKRY